MPYIHGVSQLPGCNTNIQGIVHIVHIIYIVHIITTVLGKLSSHDDASITRSPVSSACVTVISDGADLEVKGKLHRIHGHRNGNNEMDDVTSVLGQHGLKICLSTRSKTVGGTVFGAPGHDVERWAPVSPTRAI